MSAHVSVIQRKKKNWLHYDAILLYAQDVKKSLPINSGNRYFCELKAITVKANGKIPVGQTIEEDGPITLRILNGIT